MLKRKISHLILTLLLLAAPMSCMGAGYAQNAAPFYKNKNNNDVALKMHDIFKNLAHARYDVAGLLMQDLEKKMSDKKSRAHYEEELYPIYDLGKAMLMARPAGTGARMQLPPSAWKAMTLVRNVYVRGEDIDQANAFLGDDEILLSVDMIKNFVEKRLVEETQKENTVEAYEKLIAVLDPHQPSYAQVKRRLAELEFEVMCKTASGCHAYLRDYPDSPLVGQAKERSMKLDFEEAKVRNTKSDWKKYISSYELVGNSKNYVDEARARLKNLEDEELLRSDVTLKQLDDYASTTRRDVNSRIFTFYDNLINLPMHSYRYMSLKLNFGGATGRVEEVVNEANGNSFSNYFVFNAQGLLEYEYNGRNKILTHYTYGFDGKSGFYPVSKTVGKKTFQYTCSYLPGNGHLRAVLCSDGSSMTYTYDDRGRLTGRVEVGRTGKKESTFKSGKIRTEKSGRVLLKFLRYDDGRATEIVSENGKSVNRWTYSYQLDEQGRWVVVHASLNGKPRIKVTRSYGNR